MSGLLGERAQALVVTQSLLIGDPPTQVIG